MGAGLLHSLYMGDYKGEIPAGRQDFSEKAVGIAESYKKIIKAYPPGLLEKKGIPGELWDALKKLGIFGLLVPEEYGGLGLSLSDYLMVVETMATKDMALALIPIAHISIGMKGILLYGNAGQKKEYLPRAATGEMIFAYALTEPKKGSDARHVDTEAALSEDKSCWILNGTKTYITNGGYAGGLTVFAHLKNSDQMAAFIVETEWAGVKIGKNMDKMGLKISSTTSIQLKDVRVPAKNLLGAVGDGFKIAMTILNYGRLGLGAASTGIIKQSLEDMIRRAESRKQFDLPINRFQLIREKIARAKVYGKAVEKITYYTAALLQKDPLREIAIESSHCKLFGTNRAWDVLYDALQTAGGAGYLKNLPYEKRMRDFRVTTVFEGTTEIHSIYPPLSAARQGAKILKKLPPLKQWFYLFKQANFHGPLKIKVSRPLYKKALKTATRAYKTVRKMLFKGMRLYKKGLAGKELFLRRITTLSVYFYILLTFCSYQEDEDLPVLKYLIGETEELLKNSKSIRELPLEKQLMAVYDKSFGAP